MQEAASEIVVVGAGPAGLATAHELQAAGLKTLILERGCLAEHITRFPVYLTFFSTADLLELAGFPLIIAGEKPTRREYLTYLRRFVREMKLEVRTGWEVTELEGEVGRFLVRGRTRVGEPFEVGAERVVLATGAFATPQRLEVPGEDLPKVSHYYHEAHPYFGSKVLVVGGRNSAAEAALELWRAGVEVSLCHRGAQLGSLKYWLGPDIENRIKNGEVVAYMPARVAEIRPASVRIDWEGHGPIEIANDFVLALTGYRPDPAFLARMGIGYDPATGRPRHDDATLESDRAGVYLAGVMLAGNVSSEIFIENSRTHGRQILAHLRNGGSG